MQSFLTRGILAAFVLFAAVAVFGCAPTTPYRYTALTPAAHPIAWDGRGAPGGTLHVEGEATRSGVMPDWAPTVHSTAIHVSRLSLDGAALLEPVRGFNVGLRGTYSAYAWSEESTVGTMPIPSKTPLWGIGPEVRLWLPLDRNERFALGFAANAMFYTVPYAEWTDASCTQGQSFFGGSSNQVCSGSYYLSNDSTDLHTVMTVAAYPSVGIGDHAKYGDAFLLLGVTQGFSNDGFATEQSFDGKISTDPVGLFGAGYGFRYEWVKVTASTYVPVGGTVHYLPGGALTIGFEPRLWGGHGKIGPKTEPEAEPPEAVESPDFVRPE